MSELSDEASEAELLNCSLTMWHGEGQAASQQELDIPLDLHTAASIGQYEVVKDSIERGEKDLDQKNRGGWTPLMYASYIGYDTVVRMLLQAGANVNMSTPEGQTPLMLAASCGNECAAAFLLQQGAELEMKDTHGWTALFHCTSAGHQQMVKFLLDSGANANCRLFGPKRKMTSAIARWHSSARPLSDALELAYADRLEAEMQELAIQLHKRCEEVKGLKGQVSQEQELRAVVESCLMEQDVAWSNAQAQLQEVQGITRSAGILLEQIRACQVELASRINQEQAGSQELEIRAQLGASPEGWSPTLKALSLPELSVLLEECVGEMGETLCSVNRNLERLHRPEKGKAVRKQP
ncbi:ankyrin repeat and SAM domain-containing protein 3 [Notechis scutatus]|uniref:Ankyrin repeat and SAM domain-containing protein 3 n=1 Tax=Notechis scutatus TaxID=8663 RepID=A0A6J1V766_9SAUR|nr:ankyrin repeat and SAM domain-containing protein 3 [Notechis scutatus]